MQQLQVAAAAAAAGGDDRARDFTTTVSSATAAALRPPPPPPPPFTLHPILGDNAVLQRAPARAAIYGWAQTAGATIIVHFRGKTYQSTVAANDTSLGALMWRVELPPTPASTVPEDITVTGLGATATLSSVLFGDVSNFRPDATFARPQLLSQAAVSETFSCLLPRAHRFGCAAASQIWKCRWTRHSSGSTQT